MNAIVKDNKKLFDQIFKNHSIEKAYLFGSALNKKFNKNSDLDFLIKFDKNLSDPLEKDELWWNFQDTLRELFKREIDIVTENSLKNPYFIKELERTKHLIYESYTY
ncbi:nucleotidyltransferase family protein [Aequorivita capsosiphonis]|uniref:nucleotidyltransferase family protein n=1 Tax=Aequorivita capsosiphonis TaxID=487317 RepID=UPI0004163BC8|nr:nucleotidyltransferase domain-containing protein [Aequorivita capsosiphonis]